MPLQRNTPRTHARCTSCRARRPARSLPRPSSHQLVQPKIPPRRLPLRLRRALDAKGCVLIGHDIVLVLGIDGLQMRRDVDVLWRQLRRGRIRE
jgi:hypothetical protein